mgnify:CR=1 FL=1
MAYVLNCAAWHMAAAVCHALRAVAYRTYAIRPYNCHKTRIGYFV